MAEDMEKLNRPIELCKVDGLYKSLVGAVMKELELTADDMRAIIDDREKFERFANTKVDGSPCYGKIIKLDRTLCPYQLKICGDIFALEYVEELREIATARVEDPDEGFSYGEWYPIEYEDDLLSWAYSDLKKHIEDYLEKCE